MHRKKHIWCAVMIAVIVATDQITKLLAEKYLSNGAVPFIKGVVQFNYVRSIGVIVSGGLGNLIDRAFYGYVIDFIEPVFINFAIFNIADCAVTLGAFSLIFYIFSDFLKKEKKE